MESSAFKSDIFGQNFTYIAWRFGDVGAVRWDAFGSLNVYCIHLCALKTLYTPVRIYLLVHKPPEQSWDL